MNLKKWLSFSLINLLLVALLGTVLRYKIAFSLSFIDQKNLLHGHSHFAFSGWVSQALMALVVSRLSAYSPAATFKRYNWILWANLICAYGMLVSFPAQGYGLFSIIFSTLELVVSYIFMAYVWRDVAWSGNKSIILPWFKAAAFFNALSSVGALTLAFMMATKNMHQHLYLGSVYFFLHFQYNGWFMFAILGLLFEKLEQRGTTTGALRNIFKIFLFACVPAYFLSALWMPIPAIVYWLVVIAAFAQVAAWGWTVKEIIKNRDWFTISNHRLPYYTIGLSLLALTIKVFLQLGSTIPSLSKLAFGFRPIVIGYLHLVLLGVTTLFIIGYVFYTQTLHATYTCRAGLKIFITGIIANEVTLMIQGLAAIWYVPVPYINEVLFSLSVFMLTGLILLNVSHLKWQQYACNNNSKLAGSV